MDSGQTPAQLRLILRSRSAEENPGTAGTPHIFLGLRPAFNERAALPQRICKVLRFRVLIERCRIEVAAVAQAVAEKKNEHSDVLTSPSSSS